MMAPVIATSGGGLPIADRIATNRIVAMTERMITLLNVGLIGAPAGSLAPEAAAPPDPSAAIRAS